MTNIKVIINEQHSLLPQQAVKIEYVFPGRKVDFIKVPAAGWTLEEIKEVVEELKAPTLPVIFVSPIPALMVLLSAKRHGIGVFTFHNDKRVAKEISNPDGTTRIIHTVAPDGWEIV